MSAGSLLFPTPRFGGRVAAASWFETGSAWHNGHGRAYKSAFSLGLFGETIIGPFVIGASFGEDSNRKLFSSIGNLFGGE